MAQKSISFQQIEEINEAINYTLSGFKLSPQQLNRQGMLHIWKSKQAANQPQYQVYYSLPSDVMYELPSVMNKRATAIGFGKKVDLVPKDKSPSPDRYEKKSYFEASPKKGTSFGLGRQNIKAVSIFLQTSYPGPGQYENTMKQSVKSYEMRGREIPALKSMHTPGPGSYQLKSTTDKQFFADSRKKSPPNYSIRKGKENVSKANDNIGPGTYQTSLASMGRQILGTKKTEKTVLFSKQARQTMTLSNSTIGPGSYSHFSQFGI